MNTLIQDTARNNLVKWTAAAVAAGHAKGAILSPFTSPVTATASGYKSGAQQVVARLREKGCAVWFDPMTHALQMDGVGDWRYYDQWNLWAFERGNLESREGMLDHVRRVFKIQDQLEVPRLAPTVLLHSPQSQLSFRALELAEVAATEDPAAAQSICGDPHFWASEDDLDAHIGALAQTAPPQWFLSVARTAAILPVTATPTEVAGLCRTTRSLSENSNVHISHGDLASLPAVAAGADSVGTGWDPRQRVLAYSDFQAREEGGDGGQWYKRPTLKGLLGSLMGNEFALLESRHPRLAERLLPGVLSPGAQEAFMHHVYVLNGVASSLKESDYRGAYETLLKMYQSASVEWPDIVGKAGSKLDASNWVDPFMRGLRHYGAEEGW